MKPHTGILEAVERLISDKQRLLELELEPGELIRLIDFASILVLREAMGPHRPRLAGFIGCTGTGKSTLFNSLAGRALSSISWQAHNTAGPVLLTDRRFLQTLDEVEERFGKLLLPALERKIIPQEALDAEKPPAGITGSPTQLVLVCDDRPQPYVLMDLPDINTSLARRENQVAVMLQPWLDTVIFLVDDETVYHRDYEHPVQVAAELGQNRLCVIVNRGRDRIELDHPDMLAVKHFFQVDRLHVLPPLQEKSAYSDEPGFLALGRSIDTENQPIHADSLFKLVARLAKIILQENQRRHNILDLLGEEITVCLRNRLDQETPIAMEGILHDDVLHVLRHLGLRRFTLGNLLRFLKQTVTTGALRKSFHLAFGDRRSSLLEQILRFDEQKLLDEVSRRLADHGEAVVDCIRRSPAMAEIPSSAPALQLLGSSMIAETPESVSSRPWAEELRTVLHSFERECRQLISTDSLHASVKNDPLVAVSLVVALVADVLALPGFGSFVLIPSLFDYIPLGKFDSARSAFQKAIREIIRKQLVGVKEEYSQTRRRLALGESEPVCLALGTCAAFEESP